MFALDGIYVFMYACMYVCMYVCMYDTAFSELIEQYVLLLLLLMLTLLLLLMCSQAMAQAFSGDDDTISFAEVARELYTLYIIYCFSISPVCFLSSFHHSLYCRVQNAYSCKEAFTLCHCPFFNIAKMTIILGRR